MALAVTLVQLWTGARHVTLLVGVSNETREWYGAKCEWRPVELEIDGIWYEATARPCP